MLRAQIGWDSSEARVEGRNALRIKPVMSNACAINRKGRIYQEPSTFPCQAEAVRERGNADKLNAPISKARLIQICCTEARNNAAPVRIRAVPQLTAPIGFPSNAAATANDASPMIQNGRPINSSGARNHIHPP